jgi:hypothetical protein
MTYQEAMAAREGALRDGDRDTAFHCFATAHALGHDVRRHHLAAHVAMMRASWRGRHPGQFIIHAGLWGAAYLFDRSQASRTPPERE